MDGWKGEGQRGRLLMTVEISSRARLNAESSFVRSSGAASVVALHCICILHQPPCLPQAFAQRLAAGTGARIGLAPGRGVQVVVETGSSTVILHCPDEYDGRLRFWSVLGSTCSVLAVLDNRPTPCGEMALKWRGQTDEKNPSLCPLFLPVFDR